MNEEDIDKLFAGSDPPNADLMGAIGARIGHELAPVRSLPSNAVLWAIAFAFFMALSLSGGWLKGFSGVTRLSAGELVFYYGAILFFAALFARAVIERMIPGQRRLVSSAALPALAFAGMAAQMFALFQDHGTEDFVRQGIPCLELGSFSAFFSGALGWRFLLKGYLVSPGETIAIYGFFAGLVGIGALALHCPVSNWLHCLVWHLGAMLSAGVAGILLGKFWESRGYADR